MARLKKGHSFAQPPFLSVQKQTSYSSPFGPATRPSEALQPPPFYADHALKYQGAFGLPPYDGTKLFSFNVRLDFLTSASRGDLNSHFRSLILTACHNARDSKTLLHPELPSRAEVRLNNFHVFEMFFPRLFGVFGYEGILQLLVEENGASAFSSKIFELSNAMQWHSDM